MGVIFHHGQLLKEHIALIQLSEKEFANLFNCSTKQIYYLYKQPEFELETINKLIVFIDKYSEKRAKKWINQEQNIKDIWLFILEKKQNALLKNKKMYYLNTINSLLKN